MDQATVSRRVRAAEDRMGLLLFVRSPGGVQLTSLGAQLLADADPAIAQLQRAIDSVRSTRASQLRIGIVGGLACSTFKRNLRRFLKAHPDVTVTLTSGTSVDHLRSLRAGGLEAAILPGASTFEGCKSTGLWRERLLVALPSDHRLAKREIIGWSDLTRERFVVLADGTEAEKKAWLAARLGMREAEPTISVHDVDPFDLVGMVSVGFGLAIFCSGMGLPALADVVFRPIREEVTWSVVWAGSDRNPTVARFLRTLQAGVLNGESHSHA